MSMGVTKRVARDASLRKTAFGLLAILMVALFTKHSQSAAQYMERGMQLCVRTMIPSLFPFMVVAELIVRSGAGQVVARALSFVLRPLFGMSESGVCALTLGVLCGFPVGSRTAAAYYRRGEMNVREWNHVCCCCNVPSTAFLVNAVGGALFGDTAIGWWLLWLTLGAAALVGVLFRLLLPHRGVWQQVANMTAQNQGCSDRAILPASITSAASSMLHVCATVVVFSALIGTLTQYADAFGLSSVSRAAVFGFLELSTGVCEAATVTDMAAGLLLCAVMVGWAGLSIHCQILAVCEDCPISLGWFWFARLLQAGICGGGMWLLLRLNVISCASDWQRPINWRETAMLVGSGECMGTFAHVWSVVWSLAFLFSLILWVRRRFGGR